jgi:Uma2 family endonuclease
MPTMPRVPPFDRPATYQDLEALPPHLVAEIVDGELWASPRPAPRHSRAWGRITSRIEPAFDEGRGGPGGWIILGEPEVHLGKQVLVPDLAGWRRTRLPRLPVTAYIALAPDWVCEVVSPSTARLDRAKKLGIYAAEGVRHAWLVDPLARTIEVLRLTRGRWAIVATHAGDATVRIEPFEEIELEIGTFWEDAADEAIARPRVRTSSAGRRARPAVPAGPAARSKRR